MASSSKAHGEAHLQDGDQRPHPTKEDEHTGPRFEEGKEQSHIGHDPKDSRSLTGRAGAEKQAEKEEAEEEARKAAEKPTDAARKHGNEPSKGAKIDEQIEREEAELLAKKDAKK